MKAAFWDGHSMKIQYQRSLHDIWVKTHENMWGREDNLVGHIGRNRDPQNSNVMINTCPYDEVKRDNCYIKMGGEF